MMYAVSTYKNRFDGANRVSDHYMSLWRWMDELGFYVPSTIFQSFRDDGRVNMKGSVQ